MVSCAGWTFLSLPSQHFVLHLQKESVSLHCASSVDSWVLGQGGLRFSGFLRLDIIVTGHILFKGKSLAIHDSSINPRHFNWCLHAPHWMLSHGLFVLDSEIFMSPLGTNIYLPLEFEKGKTMAKCFWKLFLWETKATCHVVWGRAASGISVLSHTAARQELRLLFEFYSPQRKAFSCNFNFLLVS